MSAAQGWEVTRRACEREAIARSWAVYWHENADMVRDEYGHEELEADWRTMGEEAAKRAARIRAQVIRGGR